MSLINLVLYGLAVYRISWMVTKEQGFLDGFYVFRHWLATKAVNGNRLMITIAEMFHCPYCLSVWLSCIIIFVPLEIVFILAIMGVASIVIRFTDGGKAEWL